MNALVTMVNYLNVKTAKMKELEQIVNRVPVLTQSSICQENVQNVTVMVTRPDANSTMVKLSVSIVNMVQLVKNVKTVPKIIITVMAMSVKPVNHVIVTWKVPRALNAHILGDASVDSVLRATSVIALMKMFYCGMNLRPIKSNR